MANRKNSFQDRALKYMEEKYGEEFTYVSDWGSNYANNGTQMILVQCASVSGKILVVGPADTREGPYSDNYLAVKYADKLISTVEGTANSCFSSSWVSHEVLKQTLSPALPADASFEEYCADPGASVALAIAVPASRFHSEEVQKFADAIQRSGIHGLIQFAAIDDGLVESLTYTQFSDIISAKTYQYYAVITISNGTVTIDSSEVNP